MGNKLGKREYPKNHTANDFKCFGPAATKDGEFKGVKIADLGCFNQDGSDSNKFYHAAVIQSSKDQSWWAYFQWGRTGASAPDFQFVQCSDEAEAQSEFIDQLMSKNAKRGQWTTIAGIKTLQAKPGKDCYLVRPQATRSTGLPDAKTIKSNDGAKVVVAPKGKSASKITFDAPTLKLLQDLNFATVAYARGAMASDSLPTQTAIDEARQILTEAQKVCLKVGDDADAQANSKELTELSYLLYSRIPKVKPVNAAATTWVLSKKNINGWTLDLDAFESALTSDTSVTTTAFDPFDGQPIFITHLDPKSSLGSAVYNWAPKATRNKHGGVGAMKIHNAWRVERQDDESRFKSAQDRIAAELRGKHKERAMHQVAPFEGDPTRKQAYVDSHTALLFHGTRSVNVSGILKKSIMLPKQLVGVMINGAMFGGGAYWADDWKKSAGYTSLTNGYYSSGSGAVKGRHAFMFITEVVLGNPYLAPGPKGYTEAPKGHHCVFGKAGYSQVQNNEWITYRNDQHVLRYLLEFTA